MSYERITVKETHGGAVAEIVLGPPPGNIISAALMDELSTELKRLQNDAAYRGKKLIVISGEGKHFSFGASVEEHKRESVGDMLPAFHRLIGDVITCSVPTLAKVAGACLGGGFELALGCSLMFCEEDAALGVPEIQLGVFPPPACVLLPLKCGEALASEMILTGDKQSAETLQRLGVVNRVADKGTLDDVVSQFIEKQILAKSASSLRIANHAARLGTAEHYRAVIGRLETLYLEKLMSTADAVEGIESFLEKRQPAWTNA